MVKTYLKMVPKSEDLSKIELQFSAMNAALFFYFFDDLYGWELKKKLGDGKDYHKVEGGWTGEHSWYISDEDKIAKISKTTGLFGEGSGECNSFIIPYAWLKSWEETGATRFVTLENMRDKKTWKLLVEANTKFEEIKNTNNEECLRLTFQRNKNTDVVTFRSGDLFPIEYSRYFDGALIRKYKSEKTSTFKLDSSKHAECVYSVKAHYSTYGQDPEKTAPTIISYADWMHDVTYIRSATNVSADDFYFDPSRARKIFDIDTDKMVEIPK
ncbi:MAG: hypothetical protein HC904_16385 [Blastochloris sp.]|nr:hypothetical protein [Blastochloris sp.]